MRNRSVFSLVLLPILLGAAPLDVAVEGPSELAVGNLAVLTAKAPAAQSCAWVILPATANFRVDSDRRTAYLASGDGKIASYTVILAIVADNQIAMTQHLVTIGGTPPSPEPTPPPPPIPPQPDPLGPFSVLVRDWCVTLVPIEGRAAEAAALADSFRAMAAKIAAGVVVEPVEIVAQTYAANQAAVPNYTRWATFGRKLADQLNAEAKAGTLKTPEQYARAWRLIAAGLEAVR